jgi:hypothetical protein
MEKDEIMMEKDEIMMEKDEIMMEKDEIMMEKDEKKDEKKKMIFVKKVALFSILCLFFVFFHTKPSVFYGFYEKCQESSTTNTNFAFENGENLKYKISYGKSNRKNGILLAGYAHFNLKESTINDSNNVYRLKGFGGATKFFSFFMNVKHSYSSIIDTKTFQTIESKMEITEGKYYNKNQTICYFDSIGTYNCDVEIIRKKNKVIKKKKSGKSVLKNVNENDILGAFYKLRTMRPNEVNNKDTVFFSYYYNTEIFASHFINLGEEIIETKFGKIKTIKCAPLLEIGRMFREEYGAFVWVTDDDMHIPVKLEIPILVGSIYVTLIKYENTLFDLKE